MNQDEKLEDLFVSPKMWDNATEALARFLPPLANWGKFPEAQTLIKALATLKDLREHITGEATDIQPLGEFGNWATWGDGGQFHFFMTGKRKSLCRMGPVGGSSLWPAHPMRNTDQCGECQDLKKAADEAANG